MDNKNITYKGLLQLFKNDEYVLYLINQISNKNAKERLINEAISYYAQKHNCAESEVYFGHIEFNDENIGVLPNAVVLGALQVEFCIFEAPNLKAVYGPIIASGAKIESFPELEYANNVYLNHSTIKSIPKLKKAGEVDLRNSKIEDLGLEKCFSLDLSNTSIKKIEVEKVKEVLSINNCAVEDISSLIYVGTHIEAYDANVKKVNPNLNAVINESYINPKLQNLLKETKKQAELEEGKNK